MTQQTIYEYIKEQAKTFSDVLTNWDNTYSSTSGLQQLQFDLEELIGDELEKFNEDNLSRLTEDEKDDYLMHDLNDEISEEYKEIIEQHCDYVRNQAIPDGCWDNHLVPKVEVKEEISEAVNSNQKSTEKSKAQDLLKGIHAQGVKEKSQAVLKAKM